MSASDLARNGVTIVLEYVDHETGKIPDRTQFQQMFRDASQRKSDVLLDRSTGSVGKAFCPRCSFCNG